MMNRYRTYRARLAGDLPPVPQCPVCGRNVLAPRDGGLCRRCWLKTDEGRADTLRRTQATRDRQRKAKLNNT